MDVQSEWPLLTMSLMVFVEAILSYVNFVIHTMRKIGAYRVGFVDNAETISLGRLDRKAPRQLIVRGTCCHVVNINFWRKKSTGYEPH
jgi:hypothetical protein